MKLSRQHFVPGRESEFVRDESSGSEDQAAKRHKRHKKYKHNTEDESEHRTKQSKYNKDEDSKRKVTHHDSRFNNDHIEKKVRQTESKSRNRHNKVTHDNNGNTAAHDNSELQTHKQETTKYERLEENNDENLNVDENGQNSRDIPHHKSYSSDVNTSVSLDTEPSRDFSSVGIGGISGIHYLTVI